MSQISQTNPTAPDNDLPVHIPTPANAQLASLSNTNGAWANFVGSVIVVMGWLKPSSLWNFLGMITVLLSVITTSTMYHRELQAGENIVFFSAFVAYVNFHYCFCLHSSDHHNFLHLAHYWPIIIKYYLFLG